MLRKWAAFFLALMLLPGVMIAEETVLVDGITKPETADAFSFAEDAELLEIAFPQILDCDAALLRCGGQTMLLDCATAQQSGRVTAMLEQLGVTELDYVVNTHPHYDHIEGLEAIASAVTVKAFYICHSETETDHMVKAMDVCEKYGIPVVHYADGDQFQLGNTVIDVWLKCDASCNLNERSAQMRVQFGQRTMLFTADMMPKTQKALLAQVDPELLDIDLLKYPHHGKTTLSNDFIAATSPVFAIVTNNGGKSSREGRKCLSYKHIPYANTVPGYVYCVTDGQTWLVKRLDMDKPVTVTSRPDTRQVIP